MKKFLGSKKVKMALTGMAMTALLPFAMKVGISEEVLLKVLGGIWTIVGIYVGGQSFADGWSQGKTSSSPDKNSLDAS